MKYLSQLQIYKTQRKLSLRKYILRFFRPFSQVILRAVAKMDAYNDNLQMSLDDIEEQLNAREGQYKETGT